MGICKGVRLLSDLQLNPLYSPRGPWSLGDKVGFKVALQIVRSSLEPSRYLSNQTFDTIRCLRSTYANTFMSSATAQLSGLHFQGDRGSSYHLLSYATNLPLSDAFMTGLERRMSRDVQPRMGLDYQILHVILDNIDKDLTDNTLHREKKHFLLLGLLEHADQGRVEEHEELRYVVISLLGKFKGKQGKWWHLVLIADKAKSGYQPRLWTHQVIPLFKTEGVTSGPVMRYEDGKSISSPLVEEEFHSQLTCVQSSHPHLIDPSVEVGEVFGISRFLRRESLTQATDEGVDKESQDIQNYWKTIESHQGSCARSRMRENYLEVRLLQKKHTVYSWAL
eukprot:5431047-Ditylum_brightwellii.AAC.1